MSNTYLLLSVMRKRHGISKTFSVCPHNKWPPAKPFFHRRVTIWNTSARFTPRWYDLPVGKDCYLPPVNGLFNGTLCADISAKILYDICNSSLCAMNYLGRSLRMTSLCLACAVGRPHFHYRKGRCSFCSIDYSLLLDQSPSEWVSLYKKEPEAKLPLALFEAFQDSCSRSSIRPIDWGRQSIVRN